EREALAAKRAEYETTIRAKYDRLLEEAAAREADANDRRSAAEEEMFETLQRKEQELRATLLDEQNQHEDSVRRQTALTLQE
ncbi:hypothetical protein KIPB_015765, partial [Kipferlia bialata]